jgi:aspartyl protease family protein
MQNDTAHKQQKRIGISMIALMWIALLTLLVYVFNGVLDNRRNPNQALVTRYDGNNIPEVELQRNAYGHYVTDGEINGHAVEFMLDTGATAVVVPEHIAQRLGLEYGMPIDMQTANGVISGYMTTLRQVSVGGISLKNINAYINPREQSDDVLLGMSFLKKIEFTQRRDTLILRQAPNR